jgi:RimJ/RimL family protein N-acetyltransferase
VADPGPLAVLAAETGATLVHLDGYSLPDNAWEQLRASGATVSNMEDGAFGRRRADIAIDPTLGAEDEPRCDDGTPMALRGVAYAPLRAEIRAARQARMDRLASQRNGLRVVVPGGADAAGAARLQERGDRLAAGALANRQAGPDRGDPRPAPDGLCVVVPGGTDAAGAAGLLGRLCVETGLFGEVVVVAPRSSWAELPAGVTAREPFAELPQLLAKADFAVAAAGTSVIELACIGTPFALVAVADNQLAGYRRAVAAELGHGLGTLDELRRDPAAATRLRQLVLDGPPTPRVEIDGLGAQRVVANWQEALDARTRQHPAPARPSPVHAAALSVWPRDRPRTMPSPPPCHAAALPDTSARTSTTSQSQAAVPLIARLATDDDSLLILRWRNDPVTRAVSRNHDPVPWADHQPWFHKAIRDDARAVYIVELGGQPVGTVRFDQETATLWEVSINLAPEARGRGLGKAVLAAAEQAFAPTHHGVSLKATVLGGNAASAGLFEGSGYRPAAPR